MALYAMHVGTPSVQYRQAPAPEIATQMSEARDAATVRDLCLPLVQVYSSQTSMVRELSDLWRNGLLTALCWAVLCAIMFSWVFAVLHDTEQPAPVPV